MRRRKPKFNKVRRLADCLPCVKCGLKPATIRDKAKVYWLNCFNWGNCADSPVLSGYNKAKLKKDWNKLNRKGK
jgi:hypothetical protein